LRIVTIVGARPQFIKAAALSRAIREQNALAGSGVIEEILVHTGQHYDQNMSQVFFDELDIPAPDYNLGVGSLPHGAQTGHMLEKIEEVLLKEQPDWVLVYGDTNSTLAGALAATKLHVRVAHVEAGLRSFNRRMPEEINRVIADHISDLLFAPTEAAVVNLRCEGIAESRIHQVGDVMYDAAIYYAARARGESRVLERLGLGVKGYALATVHRAENTDDIDRLGSILAGLLDMAEEIPLVFPLHPRTRAILERAGMLQDDFQGIHFIEPVGYLEMIMLECSARIILTDSGGIQKEAYWFGVPCITLREETEWVEIVQAGWNVLVGADREHILRAVRSFALPAEHPQLFGDGHSAARCVSLLQ
jgi:UDP-GlcNAc3NAcA epimerase